MIRLGFKNLSENFASLVCFTIEKFSEITLRNHCNLRKLIFINADYLLNLSTNVFDFRYNWAVRHNKLGIGALLGKALSPFIRSGIFRIAVNFINFVIIFKFKLYKGWCICTCIFWAKSSIFPVIPACLAVKRIRNRIKNSCFACARIARDKIYSALSEFLHIKGDFTCIRTKCRHCNF